MTPDLLADELADHIRTKSKGQYLLLAAAIEANGGTLVIDPAAFPLRRSSGWPRGSKLSRSIRLRLPMA